MSRAERDYDDIPGTYVFDGARCRQGYALNKFCMSLNSAPAREDFRSRPEEYLDRYDLTTQQRKAVVDRDWLGLLQLGGNIYYTFKLAIFDGLTMQDVGGAMSGMTRDEFTQMMVDGGRAIDGNRSKRDGSANHG